VENRVGIGKNTKTNGVAFFVPVRYENFMKFLTFLSRRPVILASFIIFILVGYSFSLVQPAIGGNMLDMIMSGADAQARLSEMTAEQKHTHMLATAVLDTLYPLAYGSVLLGMTAWLGGLKKTWLFLPALGGVIFDLLENGAQILGLAGSTDFLLIKNVVTPAKFGCVLAAAFLVVILILRALYRKLAAPK